jgi:hypothetical protein
MSADYNFDYEFILCNCSFPLGEENCTSGHCDPFSTTYALCTLPDPSGTRYQIIYDKIIELLTLISQIKHLRNFSSFVVVDNYRYKITITNESFVSFV